MLQICLGIYLILGLLDILLLWAALAAAKKHDMDGESSPSLSDRIDHSESSKRTIWKEV